MQQDCQKTESFLLKQRMVHHPALEDAADFLRNASHPTEEE